MSIPANRLASMRSYNYQHVLVICNSTDTSDALLTTVDPDVWAHADSNAGPLGRYEPKMLNNDSSKQYCVLINGSTDASFSINSAHWEATTAGDATPQDSDTSVAIEGTLDILEPRGVVFMDQIVKCCTALNVAGSDAVYCLKTFFVGYSYDESQGDTIDYIFDVPPISFTATNITGSFTEQGGSYEMTFVGMAGGGTRLPQYSKIPSSLTMQAESTLGATLKSLEAKVRSLYEPYFKCVYSQIQSALAADNQKSQSVLAALQRVTYNITYDKIYENYTVTNESQVSKDQPGCSAPAMVTTSSNMSIEDAIHAVMHSSIDVTNDLAKGDSSGKWEYRIHAMLEHTKDGPIVSYHVGRFLRPMDAAKLSIDKLSDDNSTTADVLNNPLAMRNILQLDYIYTGKNIDILEFEMSMAQGLTYLQTATITNSFKDQTETVPSTTIQPMSQDMANINNNGKISPIPVFFGSKVTIPRDRNSQNPIDTSQAAYSLIKHSSIEVAGDATVKIVGNINMLCGINRYTSPGYHKQRIDNLNNSSNQQAIDTPQTAMTDFGITPLIAHINIKMPRNNDDLALLSGTEDSNGKDYTIDFWFDGFYYILGIESDFDGGQFTQTLHMVGLPKTILNSDQTDQESDNQVDLTQNVEDCYMSRVGCGQPTNGTGTANTTVPSNTTQNGKDTGTAPAPTNKADANAAASNAKAPTDVVGWSSASPAMKTAIMNSASQNGTSATTLAQMCQIESHMGRDTMNPTSSARGPFQIVNGTWNQVVNTGRVPGVPAGTPFSAASNVNANAAVAGRYMVTNQRGLMPYVGVNKPSDVSPGDTYLAHFLGLGGAQAVIQSDNSSNGSMTVRDAYIAKWGSAKGQANFNSAMRANKTIISMSTTVGELRARSAAAMAKGVPLASVNANGTVVKRQKPYVSANQSSSKTRSGADAMAASRDCNSEQAKDNDPTKTTCNQAVPTPDKTQQQSQTQPSTGRY